MKSKLRIEKRNDEEEDKEFHSFELEDQTNPIKHIFDGWWVFEQKKIKEVRNIRNDMMNQAKEIRKFPLLTTLFLVAGVSLYCLDYNTIPY